MNAPTLHNRSTYVNHRCRCGECRKANTDWQRGAAERRRQALMAGTARPKHGTQSTYNNYRCRCEPCRQAHSARCRADHRRRRGSGT